MDENNDTPESDIEWENRVLCGDGNCIGAIGPDGRCNICGLISDPDSPDEPDAAGGIETADGYENDDEDDPGRDDAPPVDLSDSQQDEEDMDDLWENRVLCSDGNCIGVIGPDGTCNECGKAGPS